ncbi:MAG: MFS transporter [Candidatus Methanomethylophilaceae archaeon]|nr:MFS transporter [Candidatus Methanomethylophilaceae archaeon]
MNGDSFRPTKLTLLAIMLCSMLMLMGGAAVAPALPLINEVFPDSEFLVSLIITLPSLAIAVLGFAIGALADRFGKVRVLTLSLLVFVVAGVAGFFLDDLMAILVARFILGIGVGGVSATVTALIAEYYVGMDRAKVMSYQSAAMGVGVLILEYTGGSLAEMSWREPFLVYLIGVPILFLCILSMREPVRQGLAETQVRHGSANKGTIILCYVTIFMLMLMAFLIPTKFPYFLEGIGVSSSVTGLFLGVHGVSNAVVSLMYRRFVQVISPFNLMGAGFIVMGVGLCLLMLSPTVVMAVVVMVLTGMAIGMIVPAVANTLASQATASTSGKIMGGYTTCLNLGQFSISLVSVPLFVLAGSTYPNLFMVMGVVALIAGLAFLIGTRLHHTSPEVA